jgi:hypothetical protein
MEAFVSFTFLLLINMGERKPDEDINYSDLLHSFSFHPFMYFCNPFSALQII